MNSSSSASPIQSSQCSRTHENFCIQFCTQVEKYTIGEYSQSNEKYAQKIIKILSQLSEERRWHNFTKFIKQRCENDGGELFSNFVSSWYAALGHVNASPDYVSPMLLLIMEIMKCNNLKYEPSVALQSVIEEQVIKMNEKNMKIFSAYLEESFINSEMLHKRWLSATATFLHSLVHWVEKCISWERMNVNGVEYRAFFLSKLLDDVVSCNSFKELVILLSECSLHDILDSFVERFLQSESTPEVCLKLILVIPEVISWRGEQICDYLLVKANFSFEDLYMLSVNLHELFESNIAVPKLFFARLKRNRQFVSSSRFALICLLSLCNTARYHSLSVVELKYNIVKLQKHSDRLRGSAWIRDVMGDCDVEALKNNLDAVVSSLVNDSKWSSVIGDALEQIAFMLLLDKCNSDVKFSDGRIVDNVGAITMGKSILVSLAEVNSSSIGQLLERILTVLSTCVKQNTAYILIDAIVEIVLKQTIHVLNAWKSLRTWMDSICDLKEADIAISLIRALLPVIMLRPELVAIVLKKMKKYVLCDSTVATVLPILLLLLRCSTVRAVALQNMGVDTKSTNAELSLEIIGILKRTFSQPASVKSMLYKGIVEAVFANQNLVHPTLDLLLTHFATLQEVSCAAYVESSKSSTVLLEPLSDLVQAVSLLLRLAIYSLRNTSTQVVSGKDAKVCQAMSELDKLIEFVVDRDIHDLQLDKLSDFSNNTTGRANLCFASMMISLYDALVEHLWHVGSVLSRREATEKLLAILRRREELNEVLKEKMVKKKENKTEKATVTYSNTTPQLQTICNIVSQLLIEINEDNIDVNQECLQMLRENAFTWTMDWAQRISDDIYKCNTRAPFAALSSFSRAMIILYIGGSLVDESVQFDLWNHKRTQAIIAFSNVVSFIISKYGNRCCSTLMEIWHTIQKSAQDQHESEKNVVSLMLRFIVTQIIPKLFESHKDFEEHKMGSDFNHQAFALITTCRVLFKQAPASNEKVQLLSSKLIRNLLQETEIGEKAVLKEIWRLYIFIERAGNYGRHYTDFLMSAARQIIGILNNEDKSKETSELACINDITLEISAEMVAACCSASLTDARLAVDMMSQVHILSVDAGLVKVIDLCSRIADVVYLLLSVHTDYAVAKESICALLTAQYEALNAVVKLMLKKRKISDISEWVAVTKLAALAQGSILRIMENADENVGTLNPLDEPSLTHNRKILKSHKDETLYVTYVKSRELYQANLLLLCSALRDNRLDIQVKNNSIGVRDFRIDAEKLRQRMEELGEEEDDENVEKTQNEPTKKRMRMKAENDSND
ncbi:unnamed protein product [Thelazia callipaeda]|uniref:FANCI_HD2 domain-containing protein n=1 Tax=Thelazia callipaeda TaxID=103827 RepID=A0A0N5CYD3_THECL|nr:unnamed protein product [Thelazia callipaeda]